MCYFSINILLAQKNTVTGYVTNELEERLPYTTIQWQSNKIATVSDSLGNFEIQAQAVADTLIVSYVGFETQKIPVEPHEKMLWIELRGAKSLEHIVIKSNRGDNFVSTLENRHVEQVTSCELRKAPCCNLSGSFETNNSVDVNYGNAVTGATEIQMLGLRGTYTQMTMHKKPNFYGLAYPFALEYYPGTFLNGIAISKGASSVEQGAQSLTGQINIDIVKPSEDKALFVNLYQNTLNTFETNIHINKKLSNTWSVGTYLHYDNMQKQFDHDHDGFMNMPQKRQYNGMIKLLHQGKTWFNQNMIHVIQDNRAGGQLAAQGWKVSQDMNRVDLTGTLGYLGFSNPYSSFAVIYGATLHKTAELYGRNIHNGKQQSVYTNAIYSTILGNSNHHINFGGSLQADDYKENVNDIVLDRKDIMPGAFTEYSYNQPKNGKDYSGIGVILGLRSDYHNRFGNYLTPRANVKYNFNEQNIIRASAGRGWRVANIIPENLSALASNRNLIIDAGLKPEDGWNIGTNFSTRFNILGRAATFNADFYHTYFKNQIIADQDQDYKNVYFYNLNGKSFSNSLMGVLTYNVFHNFDVKIGYKYNHVRTTINNKLEQPLFLPPHRALLTLDYKTKDESWLFHVTGHYVGQQRLAELKGLPHEYFPHHEAVKSPAYININAQVTKIMGNFEVYFGGENLTNYTQHQPIIAANDAFSEYFNASQIWGPLMGIRGFVGVRYSIPQKGNATATRKSVSKHPNMVTEQFNVKGDCGMCKTRIEKAALSAGATFAQWNSKTNLLTVKFDAKSVNIEAIQKAIAKVGHDTEAYKAEKEVYEKLPACCQYKRD